MPHGSSVLGALRDLDGIGTYGCIRSGLYNIIDRAAAKTKEEQRELYGKICGCDFFLMSTNAMTLDGELVNIDGRGNRVAFLCYGPENVIVLTGLNKVTPDLESAIQRVQNVAAPPNTIRLNCDTPCSVTGRCGDCYDRTASAAASSSRGAPTSRTGSRLSSSVRNSVLRRNNSETLAKDGPGTGWPIFFAKNDHLYRTRQNV